MPQRSRRHSSSGPSSQAKVLGFRAAILVALGLLIAGPLSIITILRPIAVKPGGSELDHFLANYTALRMVPLGVEFLVLVAFVMLVSSIIYYGPREKRFYPLAGLGFAIIYVMLTSVNHMLQLVVVYQGVLDSKIYGFQFLSIFDAHSLFWTLEVLGIGFQSLAALLIAPIFTGGKLQDWTHYFLNINGIIGIAIVFLTMLDVDWILRISGLCGYTLWIVSFLLPMIFIAVLLRPDEEGSKSSRSRSHSHSHSSHSSESSPSVV